MQRLSGVTKMLWSGISPVPAYTFATMSLKTLKIRMKSVSSIKKITKAMKMVAASKMKQDVSRLENGRHFGVKSVQTMLANDTYLQKRVTQQTVKRTLLVPFTSDKGLCGGVNSGIVRDVRAKIRANRNGFKLFVIGEKGYGALVRNFGDTISQSISWINTPMTFSAAGSIANRLYDNTTDDIDQITLVYNEFKNAITSQIKHVDLMNKKTFINQFKYITKYETSEPDKDYMKHYLYEFYLATAVYHAFLNNFASETSSRMNAMENASKNAGEMLQKLTLQFNKARQAKITMELCEIISGAAAV